MSEIERPDCGHCGQPVNGWGVVDGVPLCHTGTIPPTLEPLDCYRLCTVYGGHHKVHGACCSEDFDGCSRRSCRDKGVHSLKWGECEHAVEPARPDPEFGFWAERMMDDGYPSIYQATIPLAAVLPWSAQLSVDERWQMLEEVASADDPEGALAVWCAVADAHADECSFTIEPEPAGPSALAMVAAVTGGGIRAVEVRARFDDEE